MNDLRLLTQAQNDALSYAVNSRDNTVKISRDTLQMLLYQRDAYQEFAVSVGLVIEDCYAPDVHRNVVEAWQHLLSRLRKIQKTT